MGTAADLSLNTVDQAAGRVVNFWKAWSGVGWAPWWGRLGSVVIAGGGHGDGSENDIYRFDVEARSVTRIKESAPVFYKPADGSVADKLTGWMWSSSEPNDTGTQDGELFATHEYSGLQAIPESAIPGQGASNGWLFSAGRCVMPLAGTSASIAGFKLRLGLDQKWTHQGPLSHAKVDGYDPVYYTRGTCYDVRRRLIWFRLGTSPDPSTLMCYRNTVDGSSGYLRFSNVDGTDGIDGPQVLEYASAHDCLIQGCHIVGSSPLEYTRVRVWDLATGKVYQPPQQGAAPPTPRVASAMCWSDAWNCLVFISGQGDNTIYFLKPTGNPRTAAWQWSSQTVTGVVRAAYTAGGTSAYNRLRHCTALGDVLIWCARTDEPIQMIHVSPP